MTRRIARGTVSPLDLIHAARTATLADLTEAFARLGHEVRHKRTRCPSPQHSDATPSCVLFVGRDGKARWSCKSCGAHGDLADLVRLAGASAHGVLRGLALTGDAREQLPQVAPGEASLLRLAAAQRFRANFELEHASAKQARAYLEMRRVSPEQIRRFGLGVSVGGGDLAQLFERDFDSARALSLVGLDGDRRHDGAWSWVRVVFPIVHRAGRVEGFAGRAVIGTKSNRWANGALAKSASVFGLYQARGRLARVGGRLVVTEGCFDALAVDALGLAAVAILGAELSGEQAALIAGLGVGVTLLLDGDEPGRRGAASAAERLRALGVDVEIAALEYGDPSLASAADLRAALGLAQVVELEQVVEPSDVVELEQVVEPSDVVELAQVVELEQVRPPTSPRRPTTSPRRRLTGPVHAPAWSPPHAHRGHRTELGTGPPRWAISNRAHARGDPRAGMFAA